LLNNALIFENNCKKLFVIVPLHFSWSGDDTAQIHSRRRKNGCFEDARFWFCL